MKMNNDAFKSIFFHLSAILVLFIVFIALFENKNTMILTMSSNYPHPLQVNFYYTKAGVTFDNNKVSRNDRVSGNQYYFTLPPLKKIQYARLDPARHKQEISIRKDIQILVSEWFKTSVYTADITKSEVGKQIKNYEIEKNGVQFATTGSDPHLYLNLTRTLKYSIRNLHLDILFTVLLIYIALLFFYRLYKTKKLAKLFLYTAPIKLHSLFIIGFLVVLGSHLLDYYPFIFIITGIILVDWEKIKQKEIILLAIFLGSIYITWFVLDPSIINNYRLLGQGLLIFIAYLLGLSINIKSLKEEKYYEKIIFYLFFGFFIAYIVLLLYSYIMIAQDSPLTAYGMHTYFQNEYKRLNINRGNLISTIIAYHLIFSAIILPFILFYFKKLRLKNFSYFELLLLLGTALFSLYLATEMGRRTVVFLLLLTFLYLGISVIASKFKGHNYYHVLFVGIAIAFLFILGYYLFGDTKAVKRLISTNISQEKRFQFWLPGLTAMMNFPFGGGHDVILENYTKLAHNTWIDIGKDFGIIPFIAAIVFFLVHLFYLIRITLNKTLDNFIKHIFVIFFISFIAIMMIEPVFTSDKTFFFYIIFYLGSLKGCADSFEPL